jgi:hypothetical protein
LLEAERSGGGAGLFTRVRIEESGRVLLHRPPDPEVEFELDPGQLAHVRSLVRGAHISALSSSYFFRRPAHPRAYAWRLTHNGRTVSTRDGEAPRGLTALMAALSAVIEGLVYTA